MRKDEIRASETILNYLAARIHSKDVSFSPGEDPPDAYLQLDGESIPLEITTTEVPRQPIFGEDSVRELTYLRSHRNLLKEIEKEAIQIGLLQGKYAISFSKPLSSDQFRSIRKIFKAKLFDLLKDLDTAPTGFDQNIYYEYEELAWIYKLSNKGAKLFEVFEDGAWTESPEFIEFVRSILAKAVNTKIEKLSRVMDPSTCVLVIINSYDLADVDAVLQAATGLEGLSNFLAVIVLHGNRPVVIHSKRLVWLPGDA